MITFTTCPDCGGELVAQVIDEANGQLGDELRLAHPECNPRTTELEWLANRWLEAQERGEDVEADRIESHMIEIDGRPPRLGEAAVAYASWGWPVFPLKPRSKAPASRHGFKDATTDVDRLHAWWAKHPDHNVGLATGHGFDVIDIDVPKEDQPLPGALALVKLIDRMGMNFPLVHGQVATARGGLHLYVACRGGGNGAALAPGIDYRGLGGYVVAPPSTLSGHRRQSWAWVVKPSPTLTGVAPRG